MAIQSETVELQVDNDTIVGTLVSPGTSLTHRILDGADHALSSEESQKAYSSILAAWINEMVVGARLDRYPHYAPWYA